MKLFDLIERYETKALILLAPKTQRDYARNLRIIREWFGNAECDSIGLIDIYKLLDNFPSKVQGNRTVSVLSSVFSKGVRWGMVPINPCLGVERNKEKPRGRYIEDSEWEKILATCPPHIRVVAKFAYLTAMRKSDILSVKNDQIDDEKGITVETKKTGKWLLFSWSDALRECVAEARAISGAGSEHLFVSIYCTPWTTSGFDSSWRRHIKKTGICDVHFHDIRAKAATDAKNGTGSSDYVQKLLGHSSSAMTDIYVRRRTVEVISPVL